MKKIVLITIVMLFVACEEKMTNDVQISSRDTLTMSKIFIQAVMDNDEKTINALRDPWAGGELSSKYVLAPLREFLVKNSLSPSELKYTVEDDEMEDLECVVVESTDGRIGNSDKPLVYWRLLFSTIEEKKGLYINNLDMLYGSFINKDCIKY